MTLAQAIFAAALTAVMLAVVAFGVLVVWSAARSGGGPYPTRALATRLLRTPEERTEVNRWAFYVHRITGVAVFAFLCLHVLDVGVWVVSERRFDEIHELYGSAVMRIFECGLLLALLFHTGNGLRILAIDAADIGAVGSRRLLGAVVVLTVAVGGAGSVAMLGPVV